MSQSGAGCSGSFQRHCRSCRSKSAGDVLRLCSVSSVTSPHSPHFISPANRLISLVCPGRWRDFSLFCTMSKLMRVNQRFMLFLHYNPVLRLFPNRADFGSGSLFLGSNRPGVDGIHQKVLITEKSHIYRPFSGAFFSHLVRYCEAPVPGSTMWAGDFFFFQPSAGYSSDHDRSGHIRKSAAQSGRFPRQ